jgi:hypothetical protein
MSLGNERPSQLGASASPACARHGDTLGGLPGAIGRCSRACCEGYRSAVVAINQRATVGGGTVSSWSLGGHAALPLKELSCCSDFGPRVRVSKCRRGRLPLASSRLRLHQAFPKGVANQVGGGVEIELAHCYCVSSAVCLYQGGIIQRLCRWRVPKRVTASIRQLGALVSKGIIHGKPTPPFASC